MMSFSLTLDYLRYHMKVTATVIARSRAKDLNNMLVGLIKIATLKTARSIRMELGVMTIGIMNEASYAGYSNLVDDKL